MALSDQFSGDGPFRMVGLMSGTSLDGLDMCMVEFRKIVKKQPKKPTRNSWTYRLLASETVPYKGSPWAEELPRSYTATGDALDAISRAYATWVNEVAKAFIENSGWTPDALASHGHTVLHQPDKGITRQIGNDALLANGIGMPVVCDFRNADVKRGGQGAPLVPAVDALLFADYAICLNLGGFSNASWQSDGQRFAGDLGPVNILLNPLAQKVGEPYDNRGLRAANGRIHHGLLEAFKTIPFYQKAFPKSLGREWADQHFLHHLKDLSVDDALATCAEHSAWAISHALKGLPAGKVLVTGGGLYNDHLMHRIQVLSNRQLIVPDDQVIQCKEALSFAMLGLLRLRDEVNILASVTGGERDASDGVIHIG